MSAVISVQNLSKAYRIGLKEEIPDTLVQAAASWVKAPFRNFRKLRRLDTFRSNGDEEDVVWALKECSFEVSQGDVLAVIGRNGAGKSTLLKLLSRITEPTSGRAVIRGRVSSLLEVGTGFHPELTGRKNIYMNGTLLGMTKREIDRKFDEIVDFSGVERFLDTPVKRYSSGMQVRLAFSVAAHLEPEILVIDEVLSVGDAEFQKKCLGATQRVARSGRTVLFVSHNMAAVNNLCTRGIVLDDGKLAFQGTATSAVEFYSQSSSAPPNASNECIDDYREPGRINLIKWARVVNDSGTFPPSVPLGGSITIDLGFNTRSSTPLRSPVMGLIFNHIGKGAVAQVTSRMTGYAVNGDQYDSGVFRGTIPKLPFLQGRYKVDVWLGDSVANLEVLDVLKEYLCFDIVPTDYYQSGKLPVENGTVFLDANWHLSRSNQSEHGSRL